MDPAEALGLLRGERVARLATVRPDGSPHLVPVTFAILADLIVTSIDHKPKTTTRLQRLVNIEANPRVSLLADQYSEDWTRLWWIRVDGRAVVHDHHPEAVTALADKYPQYRDRPPEGPVIVIDPTRVVAWKAQTD